MKIRAEPNEVVSYNRWNYLYLIILIVSTGYPVSGTFFDGMIGQKGVSNE